MPPLCLNIFVNNSTTFLVFRQPYISKQQPDSVNLPEYNCMSIKQFYGISKEKIPKYLSATFTALEAGTFGILVAR